MAAIGIPTSVLAGGGGADFPDCEPGESPDVALPQLTDVQRHGRVSDITAYSVGTFTCNSGACWLEWDGTTNRHPVIAQNMYRLKNGHFEHVGMSWVKHTVTPDPEPAGCLPGCYPTITPHVASHCEDTYSASINGIQSWLGPRSQVNPATGYFPYPWTAPPAPATIGRRLQVHDADLDPALNPGAVYFVEAQFVAPDDAAANNDDNNASYHPVNVVGTAPNFNLALVGLTQEGQAAVRAWNDTEGGVAETDIHVPGDGVFILAAKAVSLGGGAWHYGYAIQNLNSDRGAVSFTVPIDPAATVQNIGFHDVDYHSGEPYSGTDWTGAFSGGAVTWSTTSYLTDPNANALRWGTLYNFRFDANVAPLETEISLGLFKPGRFASVTASSVGPVLSPDCNTNGVEDDCELDCGAPGGPCDVPGCGGGADCDSNGRPDECQFDGDADGTPDACEPDGDSDGWVDDYDNCPADANADQADEDADGAGNACDPDYCRPVVFAGDFETDQGWTVGDVGDDAVAGIWTRVDPIATGGQPEDDHTPLGGSTCYVTGQEVQGGGGANVNDVDSGKTTLMSPVFRLCGDAVIGYWRWHYVVSGPPGEFLRVDLSNDEGASWVNAETVFGSNGGWLYHEFSVRDFVAPSEQMRVRFVASDFGTDSTVEAAVDDFRVITSVCLLDCNSNAVPDACDLAAGTSPDADSNGVPDECDVQEAVLISALSRKGHGAPPFDGDIPVNVAGHVGTGGVTSEPRAGGITHLRLTFDPSPGQPAPGSVQFEEQGCGDPGYGPYEGESAMNADVAGQELLLSFAPGLENARTYRFILGAPISSLAQSLEVRGLTSDANSDGLVNAIDRSIVVGVWTGPGFSFTSDLNGDGVTNAIDRSMTVGAWTGTANCAP